MKVREENDFERYLEILGDRKDYCIFGGRPEWDESGKTYMIPLNSPRKVTEWVEKPALTKLLRKYMRMGWTTWISLNEKEVANDTIEGVTRIHTFWFDFDAERKDKAKLATSEEKATALEEAKRFKAVLEDMGMQCFIACSGNGYHVFFPVEAYELRGSVFRKEFNQKQREFYKNLRQKGKFTFDTTTDIRRVTQPIGYPNMKIPDSPVPTYWVDDFALEDIREARKKNAEMIDAVLNTEIKKAPVQIPSKAHKSFEELLKKHEKLKALYEGNIKLTYGKDVEKSRELRRDTGKLVYTTRSEAEHALVTILCQQGFSDTEIKEIMRGCAIGKWQNKTEGYHDITLRKARAFAEEHRVEEEKKERKRKKRKVELKEEIMGIALKDLMNRYTFVTPDDTKDVHVYDKGIYKQGDVLIESEIEDMLGEKSTIAFVSEVIGHIQRRTYVPRSLFNSDRELLPVRNGLLNLNTYELQDFDQSKIFTYQLPVNFDSHTESPNIQEFIQSVVSEEDIGIIQEYLGYCLYPDMPAHKSLWLYGTGRNGKTTLVNLIRALLGESTTSVTLDELGAYHRFSKARMYGKLLNVVTEPTLKQMQTVDFKKLVGGDLICAEVKNVQKTIDFVNFAKFIITGNRFPQVYDTSLAFWERLIVIKFPNVFIDTAIPNYEYVLIEKDGLSGFLNWCLEGLKRLKSKKFHFSMSKGSEAVRQEFMRQSNTARAFVSERCRFVPEGFIAKDELYETYKDYCVEEGLVIQGKKELTTVLNEQPRVYAKNKKIDGKIKMCWFGIEVPPSLEAQIYEMVYRLCKEDPRGALVNVVIERVEGYTVGEVKTKVDELIEEGNLLIKSREGDFIFVERG